MHIDTGSSDLWVNTPGSTLCQSRTRPCSQSGTYTANSSSTYGYVGSYFNISYVDGSGASGDYVTDTFAIGGSTVQKFQFGVGYQSTSSQGILGIGYPVNEVQVGRARMRPYENLPAKMLSTGLISSNTFSLYLNDLGANTGNVLFGGVDTAKFEGQLQTLPIQSESGVFAEFLITLTSVSLGSRVIEENMALAVLLDSGSSLTYLPDDMVQILYSMVGAVYQADEGVAFIPCSAAATASSMTFSFSGAKITVPMDEIIIDLALITGQRFTFNNGQAACLFGISPAGTGTNVLGDTFLRSAYVVYDMDNNQISLAQTRFNSTATNVLEIAKGSKVPSAVAVANPVAATAGIHRGTQSAGPPSLAPMAASFSAALAAFVVTVILRLI
jgi:hypothetical protein